MPLLVWFSIENDSLLIAPQKPQVPATVRSIKRKLPGDLQSSPWQSISSCGGWTILKSTISKVIYLLLQAFTTAENLFKM